MILYDLFKSILNRKKKLYYVVNEQEILISETAGDMKQA